jgi:cyclophilin family peptidyl-prolyl cis-trans isomerase
MGTEKRQRQKEGQRLSREAYRKYEKQRARRRRLFLYGGLIVAFFAVLFVLSLLQDDGGGDEAATTTAPSDLCPPAEGVAEPVRTFEGPPPNCLDPNATYTAVLDTSAGEIRVDLDVRSTPDTVNNFVYLARNGYYDDTLIFRTDPSIGIVQGGGQDNSASPGYTIADEGGGFTYEPGQIVMARTSEPDSAGGQFFLVGTDAASNLDAQGTYVVFGNTDQAGIDVVNAILDTHVDGDSPTTGHPDPEVRVNTITIEQS